MYKFCKSQRQGCEYMKRDSQVKKSLIPVFRGTAFTLCKTVKS